MSHRLVYVDFSRDRIDVTTGQVMAVSPTGITRVRISREGSTSDHFFNPNGVERRDSWFRGVLIDHDHYLEKLDQMVQQRRELSAIAAVRAICGNDMRDMQNLKQSLLNALAMVEAAL